MNSSHWIVVRSTSLDSVNSMRISRIMKQPKAPFASESKAIFGLVRCVTITNRTLRSCKTPDRCTPFLNFIWSIVVMVYEVLSDSGFVSCMQITSWDNTIVSTEYCPGFVSCMQIISIYVMPSTLLHRLMLCLQHHCIEDLLCQPLVKSPLRPPL
jgi:hypothetical protein